MPSLFDYLGDDVRTNSDWRPEAPPQLEGIDEIYLNAETTGLRWWEEDRPIALSLATPDGRSWYLPWAHYGGQNLDEAVVKRWAQRELRNKLITNINTRFDVHQLREWGIDLEAQGNRVSDVQHYAALLDDHRQRSALDILAQDYFGGVEIPRLDENRMTSYSAGEAAPRAMYNVQLVRRLKEVMWPELTKQDLQRVRQLEDDVIYVVCEMEKNGSPIDLELLDRWIKESQKRYEGMLYRLSEEAGFNVNPDSPKDQERVFQKFGLPVIHTAKGSPSFTDSYLKTIDHPTVVLMRAAGKLSSLRNKFIVATKERLDSKGIFRYALHQMRATKDGTENAGESGTVTGRFSSTEITDGVGGNIQQRSKPTKQRVSFGYDEEDDSHDDEIFLVRKLHIPAQGQLWLSSDMAQVEYRLFAHFANNPGVIEAYKKDRNLHFHKHIKMLFHEQGLDMTYGKIKDSNFAKVYGAGLKKLALMMGYIDAQQFEMLNHTKARNNHPLLREVVKINAIYDQLLPEVSPLLRLAGHFAMPECNDYCKITDKLHKRFKDVENYGHRGYVTTIEGRRGRFPDGRDTHKSFNKVVQGSGADYLKIKLVELHRRRKEIGLLLRGTVHDEVFGDVADKESARRVDTLLNEQSWPHIRIPLTWETSIGPNWAECKDLD